MNPNEINFTFDGRHCMGDFGCIYLEKGGHPITPTFQRDTYPVAGVSGTVELSGPIVREVMTFSGTLVIWNDPPSQAAAQRQLREIAAWLTAGRKRLIFDYEPQRFYLAEVSDSTKWDFSQWMEGGLSVSFDAQPYAYDVAGRTVIRDTVYPDNNIPITLDTGEPAPLYLEVVNTGTAPITGVEVSIGTRTAKFSAVDGYPFDLANGQGIKIDMEPPTGAVFLDGGNALPNAKPFFQLTLGRGTNMIFVRLTYGSGTRGARITAKARGRW